MKKLLVVLAAALLVMAFMAPAQAESNVKVMLDFESDAEGAFNTPWDAGDTLTFTQVETDDYCGSGAFKIHTDDVIGLANIWYGVDFPVDMRGCTEYQGMCLRIDARSIATVDQTAQIVLCLNKGEGATATRFLAWNNVKFFDMEGNDVTPTGDDADGNPKRTAIAGTCYCFLPLDFNGWVFCEFGTANPVEGYDIETSLTFGISDWCFDQVIDTVGKDVFIDNFALYKGTDYASLMDELATATVQAEESPAPTAAPTSSPDDTGDASVIGFAAAAVVSCAAGMLIIRKKK